MSDRICLELDEYGPAGADGYGFTIEQTPDETPEGPPLVGHLRVTLLRTTSAQAHSPDQPPPCQEDLDLAGTLPQN